MQCTMRHIGWRDKGPNQPHSPFGFPSGTSSVQRLTIGA
jgi:hypothetical protein